VRESDELSEAREKIRALGRQPVDLVADFLEKLWGLALQKMAKSHSQALVDSSRFYVVLTVPAIWHDDAKEMMREAAQWAGICDERPAGETVLDLVSEPEAAALATISDNFDMKVSPDNLLLPDFLKVRSSRLSRSDFWLTPNRMANASSSPILAEALQYVRQRFINRALLTGVSRISLRTKSNLNRPGKSRSASKEKVSRTSQVFRLILM
jgi:hypothetical protein